MIVRLNEGINAFIEKFTTPRISPDDVIRGDQRTAVLPNSDNFAVFRVLSQRRVSKTQNELIENATAERFREYIEADVQIDFYGSRSFERASKLELLAESHRADDFLQAFGLDALYTTAIQNITGVLDDNQLTERWMFTFTVGYCNDVELGQDFATSIKPALIEINATFKEKNQ